MPCHAEIDGNAPGVRPTSPLQFTEARARTSPVRTVYGSPGREGGGGSRPKQSYSSAPRTYAPSSSRLPPAHATAWPRAAWRDEGRLSLLLSNV